jgi:hypothetical protein
VTLYLYSFGLLGVCAFGSGVSTVLTSSQPPKFERRSRGLYGKANYYV